MRAPPVAEAIEIEMTCDRVDVASREAAERCSGVVAEVAADNIMLIAYARRQKGIGCEQQACILDAPSAKNDRVCTDSRAATDGAPEIEGGHPPALAVDIDLGHRGMRQEAYVRGLDIASKSGKARRFGTRMAHVAELPEERLEKPFVKTEIVRA